MPLLLISVTPLVILGVDLLKRSFVAPPTILLNQYQFNPFNSKQLSLSAQIATGETDCCGVIDDAKYFTPRSRLTSIKKNQILYLHPPHKILKIPNTIIINTPLYKYNFDSFKPTLYRNHRN